MSKTKSFLVLCALCVLCGYPVAAQTTVNLGIYCTNFVGLPAAGSRVVLTPLAPLAPWTNGFLIPTPIYGYTDTNGNYVYSNVFAAYTYSLEVDPSFPPAFVTNIGIPAGLTGLINAAAYQGTWLPGMQIFAYTSTNYLLPTNYVAQGGSFTGYFYDLGGTNGQGGGGFPLTSNVSGAGHTISGAIFNGTLQDTGGTNQAGSANLTNLAALSASSLAYLQQLSSSNAANLTNLNATNLTGTVATNVLPSAIIPIAGTNMVVTVSGVTATVSVASNAYGSWRGNLTGTFLDTANTNNNATNVYGKFSTTQLTNSGALVTNAVSPAQTVYQSTLFSNGLYVGDDQAITFSPNAGGNGTIFGIANHSGGGPGGLNYTMAYNSSGSEDHNLGGDFLYDSMERFGSIANTGIGFGPHTPMLFRRDFTGLTGTNFDTNSGLWGYSQALLFSVTASTNSPSGYTYWSSGFRNEAPTNNGQVQLRFYSDFEQQTGGQAGWTQLELNPGPGDSPGYLSSNMLAWRAGTFSNSLTLPYSAANQSVLTENGSGSVYPTNAPAISAANMTSIPTNGTYTLTNEPRAVTLSNTNNSFTGNGGGLTNVNATNLTGQVQAGNATNYAILNGTNSFTGFETVTNTNGPVLLHLATGGQSLSTGTNRIMDGYNAGIERFEVDITGEESWFINSGSGELGSVNIAAPSSEPGIEFLNSSGTGRSQIWLTSSAGGLSFGAETGSGGFVGQMFLTTGGILNLSSNLNLSGSASAASGTFTNGVSSLSSNKLAPTSISFPATGANWTNTNTFCIEVYINNNTVTGSAIAKNGTTIFTAVTGDCTFHLQNGETFSETYTVGTPTATWSPF